MKVLAALFVLAMLTLGSDARCQTSKLVFRIEIDGLELWPQEFVIDENNRPVGLVSEVAPSCEEFVPSCFQQLVFRIYANQAVPKKQKLLLTFVNFANLGVDMMDPPAQWEVTLLKGETETQTSTIWETSRLKSRTPGLLRVVVLTKTSHPPVGVSDVVVWFCSQTGLGAFQRCPP